MALATNVANSGAVAPTSPPAASVGVCLASFEKLRNPHIASGVPQVPAASNAVPTLSSNRVSRPRELMLLRASLGSRGHARRPRNPIHYSAVGVIHPFRIYPELGEPFGSSVRFRSKTAVSSKMD